MPAACTAALDGQHVRYQRRRPERSVLHRVVRENLQTLLAEAEGQSEHGFGYPSHVRREFERYLSCGAMCCGFARLKCRSCQRERLVAFSCKGRAICPSCVGRKMADSAAHLVDNVLPQAPYRQWTLSLPKHVRWKMVREPALLSRVQATFLRTVFTWQRRLAKRELGIAQPLCGAVSFVQRFGSLLQLNPHFHAWLPDGVFARDADGALSFRALMPPEQDDIDELLHKISGRIVRCCNTDEVVEPDDEQIALGVTQARAMEPPGEVSSEPTSPPRPRLCAYQRGFSLHAGLSVVADNRRGLERMLSYGMRPPFSQRRLSLTLDGRVRLELRKPYHTGQTSVTFEPVDFLRRLAAIIPPVRQNLTRYFGVFAPHAKARPAALALVPRPPAPPAAAEDDDEAPDDKPSTPRYRRPWAELLSRVFALDVLSCTDCGGRMRLVALVKDPTVVRRIVTHLGLPTALPDVAPARGPPQLSFDDDADPWD